MNVKSRRKHNFDKDDNNNNNDDEDINDNEIDNDSNNSVSLSIGKTSKVDTEFEREINNEQEYERINKNSIV